MKMKPNIKRIRELADTLLSGKYSQGQHRLRDGNRYCCLGVACDISGLAKWERIGPFHGIGKANYFYLDNEHDLPEEVVQYYGADLNFIPEFLGDEDFARLETMNDAGESFKDIATVLYSFCDAVEMNLIDLTDL